MALAKSASLVTVADQARHAPMADVHPQSIPSLKRPLVQMVGLTGGTQVALMGSHCHINLNSVTVVSPVVALKLTVLH
jgi:hypothetical protein